MGEVHVGTLVETMVVGCVVVLDMTHGLRKEIPLVLFEVISCIFVLDGLHLL